MAAVPQDLVDLLNAAESDYLAALAADGVHTQSVAALTIANETEKESQTAALAAHQTASGSANAAIVAVKTHFGLN